MSHVKSTGAPSTGLKCKYCAAPIPREAARINDPPQAKFAGERHTPENPLPHFTQRELARRWRISPRTLERWRWLRQGPPYLKIGGQVVYQAADIETYEQSQRRGGGFAP